MKIWKYIQKGRRGFTMGEAVASMVSLTIVALSAQSLILMSSQFRSNQKRTFASMESQQHYQNQVCSHLQNPVAVQVDRSRTYHYDDTNEEYKILSNTRNNNKQPTLAFVLSNAVKLADTSFTDAGNFKENLGPFNDSIMSKVTAIKNDKSIFFIEEGQGAGTPPPPPPPDNEYKRPSIFYLRYFPVYADSHTIVNYIPEPNVNNSSSGGLGLIEENSGFIIATRCIENTKFHKDYRIGALVDSSDLKLKVRNSTNPIFKKAYEEAVDTQALYILTNQMVPFYFPKHTGLAKIFCAEHPSFPDDTISFPGTISDAHKKYTPVTFIIEFEVKTGVIDEIKTSEATSYTYATNNNKSYSQSLDGANKHSSETDTMFIDPGPNAELEYKKRIQNEFAIGIDFTRITEIPFNQDNINIWASTFIAESPSETSSNFFNLNFVDIRNTCNPSLLDCYYSPEGKTTLDDLKVSTKTDKIVSDFFQYKTKSCPFKYSNLENSGQAVSLGVTIESN